MQLRLFPVYYHGAAAPDYRSDCVEPIMAGTDPHWAELTAHEKILNEWLPAHPDERYLGFCHYRRFPDFWRAHPSKYLPHVGFQHFARDFAARYAESRILPMIDGYDVIVPCPSRWSRHQPSVRDNYSAFHPVEDLERLCAIIRRDYPDMVPDMESYLAGRVSRQCLNFILRRDWFEAYLVWEFDILRKLAQQTDWQTPRYQTFFARRTPAFLAERFFNVFINHKLRTSGGRLLERQLVLLVPDEETRLGFRLARLAEFARDIVKGFLPQ